MACGAGPGRLCFSVKCNKRFVCNLRAPACILHLVHASGGRVGRLSGRGPIFSHGACMGLISAQWRKVCLCLSLSVSISPSLPSADGARNTVEFKGSNSGKSVSCGEVTCIRLIFNELPPSFFLPFFFLFFFFPVFTQGNKTKLSVGICVKFVRSPQRQALDDTGALVYRVDAISTLSKAKKRRTS